MKTLVATIESEHNVTQVKVYVLLLIFLNTFLILNIRDNDGVRTPRKRAAARESDTLNQR